MKKDMWIPIKELLEKKKEDGSYTYTVRQIAEMMDYSTQNVYRYMKDNGFKRNAK